MILRPVLLVAVCAYGLIPLSLPAAAEPPSSGAIECALDPNCRYHCSV